MIEWPVPLPVSGVEGEGGGGERGRNTVGRRTLICLYAEISKYECKCLLNRDRPVLEGVGVGVGEVRGCIGCKCIPYFKIMRRFFFLFFFFPKLSLAPKSAFRHFLSICSPPARPRPRPPPPPHSPAKSPTTFSEYFAPPFQKYAYGSVRNMLHMLL